MLIISDQFVNFTAVPHPSYPIPDDHLPDPSYYGPINPLGILHQAPPSGMPPALPLHRNNPIPSEAGDEAHSSAMHPPEKMTERLMVSSTKSQRHSPTASRQLVIDIFITYLSSTESIGRNQIRQKS